MIKPDLHLVSVGVNPAVARKKLKRRMAPGYNLLLPKRIFILRNCNLSTRENTVCAQSIKINALYTQRLRQMGGRIKGWRSWGETRIGNQGDVVQGGKL